MELWGQKSKGEKHYTKGCKIWFCQVNQRVFKKKWRRQKWDAARECFKDEVPLGSLFKSIAQLHGSWSYVSGLLLHSNKNFELFCNIPQTEIRRISQTKVLSIQAICYIIEAKFYIKCSINIGTLSWTINIEAEKETSTSLSLLNRINYFRSVLCRKLALSFVYCPAIETIISFCRYKVEKDKLLIISYRIHTQKHWRIWLSAI